MTAYLGTDEVRSLIVPQDPPPDLRVAANYEKFDGTEQLDNPAFWDPISGQQFSFDYAPSPVPGFGATKPDEQVYTRGPNKSLVNTLGGQPLPVLQWNYQPTGSYTPAGTRQYGGPKMGKQMYAGAAETVFFADLQSSPPVPGDLASIIQGLA